MDSFRSGTVGLTVGEYGASVIYDAPDSAPNGTERARGNLERIVNIGTTSLATDGRVFGLQDLY